MWKMPAMAFLGYNLTTHRTVSCDSEECLASAGKNWGKLQTESFKWSEVTATGIITEIVQSAKTRSTFYYFTVGVGGREIASLKSELVKHIHDGTDKLGKEIRLLRNKTEDFALLMRFAAEKTPQLSYIWVEHKDVMNHLILLEVGNFCKVSRN